MNPPSRGCLAVTLSALLSGCIGTTGGDLFEFDAYAAGPADADGGALSFRTGRGYAVTLERARLHVGAVYLNRSVPVSVSSDTSCTQAGVYVAEVPAGIDVDLLSAEPSRFPVLGAGTEERSRTGEVWLTGGNVDDPNDPTEILEVAGVAARRGEVIAFEGVITIGQNRAVPPESPAQPGANPICKQRIVSPIPADLSLESGGQLIVRADPRGFFANVDFGTLPPGDSPEAIRRFADSGENQASINLFSGLRAVRSYSFEWR